MFEKFIARYFSENSFLELANACFNEAGIYFARNTESGMRKLAADMKDEPTSAYLAANRAALLEETKEHGCDFLVAMPMSHQAFPAPYRVVVDQCMGEVTFLCGFERVFREREERKRPLSVPEREELTAVIRILACASRAAVDWGEEKSLTAFLSSPEACNCVGYDVAQYFLAYDMNLCSYYLKALLDCVPLLNEEGVRAVVKSRAQGGTLS